MTILGQTIAGIILSLIFIIPGFIAANRFKREIPFKKVSTFEIIAQSFGFSVITHTLLLIISLLIHVYFRKENVESLQKLHNLEWNASSLFPIHLIVSIGFLYVLISMFLGLGLGYIWQRVFWHRKGSDELLPVWTRMFSDPEIRASVIRARIKTKAGKIYIGDMKYISMDREAIDNGTHEIVLSGVYAMESSFFNVSSIPINPDSPENSLVYLRMPEISSIEIVRD